MKQYREEHKEEKKKGDQKYRKENLEIIRKKDKIRSKNRKKERETYMKEYHERMKEKIHCSVCECEISRGNLNKHNKTQKHKNNTI